MFFLKGCQSYLNATNIYIFRHDYDEMVGIDKKVLLMHS